MVKQRDQSAFAEIRGTEEDKTIKEKLSSKKADSIEWLISQLRSDPKIFEFTKAGYSFRPESY